ncbi:GNAT family N-acetyltransferase [Pseudooceanicola sediminis]|uniref:GNAT family N-acetyltransferase n=1 Tax=Pseudooceanicola sediminis TaxID=2211117 RepID=A0A399IX36_9RHOB|nr:GNAT family N-acetyltransferase [Pseudooceanicola sediminis]KAA2312533.1 GNAT family N-acetyltransferase [Puniceibacterium sp. HSS470]RII37540.1 GNAT family N-acetyltransferase [Pseudooceanicola sediminis]|tara:strand:+ start:50847 stop:51593 length:747 start_codon:yes stop_codon:yes gene_type:complete
MSTAPSSAVVENTDRYMAVVDATWPPAQMRHQGAWLLRRGGGGGKRVSAASAMGPVTDADVVEAEAAMRAMSQPLLFSLRPGQEALDAKLAARGYVVVDPVNIYACPVNVLAEQEKRPEQHSLATWEPLAIQREIWATGGIGDARIDVMLRAGEPRTTLIGRFDNSPAGTAFVAVSDHVGMLHALEVLEAMRGRGMGKAMMIDAARWAAQNGANTFSVVCTQANIAANALYTALGMTKVGHYHYRQKD